VSTIGHYFSIGTGATTNYTMPALDLLASYSFAFKSHLVSLSFAASNSTGRHSSADPYNYTDYAGILIGESLRRKHFMFSFSGGISYSTICINDPAKEPRRLYYYRQGQLSVPLELKAFLVARKWIGIGIQASENIISPLKYSPFYCGLALVVGRWNK
jgi:hypothetical protein